MIHFCILLEIGLGLPSKVANKGIWKELPILNKAYVLQTCTNQAGCRWMDDCTFFAKSQVYLSFPVDHAAQVQANGQNCWFLIGRRVSVDLSYLSKSSIFILGSDSRRRMESGSVHSCPGTVEKVLQDFKGRRDGIIKALTIEIDEFYALCDPEKGNLCLFGYPDGSWDVNRPADELPPELPEPLLGINFVREEMDKNEWISLVAAHSDAWLSAVWSYIGARSGFHKNERNRLFSMINEFPTIHEITVSFLEKQIKDMLMVPNTVANNRVCKSECNEQQLAEIQSQLHFLTAQHKQTFQELVQVKRELEKVKTQLKKRDNELAQTQSIASEFTRKGKRDVKTVLDQNAQMFFPPELGSGYIIGSFWIGSVCMNWQKIEVNIEQNTEYFSPPIGRALALKSLSWIFRIELDSPLILGQLMQMFMIFLAALLDFTMAESCTYHFWFNFALRFLNAWHPASVLRCYVPASCTLESNFLCVSIRMVVRPFSLCYHNRPPVLVHLELEDFGLRSLALHSTFSLLPLPLTTSSVSMTAGCITFQRATFTCGFFSSNCYTPTSCQNPWAPFSFNTPSKKYLGCSDLNINELKFSEGM
eukprot:Gb_25088 [translate_table: standard]